MYWAFQLYNNKWTIHPPLGKHSCIHSIHVSTVPKNTNTTTFTITPVLCMQCVDDKQLGLPKVFDVFFFFLFLRATDWLETNPWLRAIMSSCAKCVTETLCLTSLSRRRTSCGATGKFIWVYTLLRAFLGPFEEISWYNRFYTLHQASGSNSRRALFLPQLAITTIWHRREPDINSRSIYQQ